MNRVFLIGYMGSGKTTIGRLLAEQLGFSFIDLDTYIENRFQKKVRDIFAQQGEEKFREIEHRMLAEVSEMENIVVSTGGGAPCFHDNMRLINESGISIYIKSSAKDLAKRLSKAKDKRPLLHGKTDEDLPLFIQEMLTAREPFYTQATYIINNNEKAETAVTEILNLLS